MTKMLKSILSLFLAVFMVASLMAVPSSAISISKSSVTLTKGYQTTLSVTGTTKSVTWSTGDKSIATVTSKGKVVGKKVGSTYIYAKVGGNTLKCKVNVVAAKITASSSTVTLDEKGDTKTVTMTVKGSHSKVTVGSTNKNVATASWTKPAKFDGDKIKITITAKGSGTAKIKVYLKDYPSTCYKYITVNVNDNELITDDEPTNNNSSANRMSIMPYTTSVPLSQGGSYVLQVYSTNQNNMEYKLTDTSIASVSAGRISGYYRNYTITGNKAGTTTLRFYDKNDTNTYKDVTITVTANTYYELYTVRPTVTNVNDQVIQIQGSSSNSLYYMLVPANYDPALVNDAIAKKFNRYSYYEIYTTVPSRIASTDTYYEFVHSNSKYNYGRRYILIPQTYDKVDLNTAIAGYNEMFDYWTVYSASPTKTNQWDYVETWQITDAKTGKYIYRYLLVPYYGYDADRISEIKNNDISSNSAYSYYIGYSSAPTVNSAKDQTIMYRKGNTYKYMVVPADNSGIAKANEAIAKDVGFYEYNVIYPSMPTVTGTEIYNQFKYGGTVYYVLLKDADQSIDANLAVRYANGVKDD